LGNGVRAFCHFVLVFLFLKIVPWRLLLSTRIVVSGPKNGGKGRRSVKSYSPVDRKDNQLYGRKVFFTEEFTIEGKTEPYNGASGTGWDAFKSPDGQEYVVFEHLVLESGLKDDHGDAENNWGVACDRLFKPQADHPGYLLYLDTLENVSYEDLWNGRTKGKLLLLHADSCRTNARALRRKTRT